MTEYALQQFSMLIRYMQVHLRDIGVCPAALKGPVFANILGYGRGIVFLRYFKALLEAFKG
jgi:hypothetical protein